MAEPMSAEERETLKARYADFIGFTPSKIETRFQVSSALDPDHLRLQEQMRAHCMHPACFDRKTSQLMLFGMLLVERWEGARFHGIAARRAGATWEELHAVVAMAGLTRGLTALNFATDVLHQIMQAEQEPAEDDGGRA
jgi:4-carboxymuconolactone decarboxylase